MEGIKVPSGFLKSSVAEVITAEPRLTVGADSDAIVTTSGDYQLTVEFDSVTAEKAI